MPIGQAPTFYSYTMAFFLIFHISTYILESLTNSRETTGWGFCDEIQVDPMHVSQERKPKIRSLKVYTGYAQLNHHSHFLREGEQPYLPNVNKYFGK